MFSSRIITFFFAFLTLGLVTYANPVAATSGNEVAKRQQVDSIEAVFANLKASTDSILPQIDALVDSGSATDDNVAPLVTQLTEAFTTADTDLTAFNGKGGDGKPHNKDELAKVIAGILIVLVKTINKLLLSGAKFPIVGGLLITLQIIVNKLLLSVELLLAGILKLLAILLVDVAILLKSISWGLILATLGL
ncbi:sc15 protein [Moniliophthora roreri MCA 2997]|uniref:Sc15 protein n=2 Tax=Moniliophthora roreri TaxID=221103 RepID=V2XRC3_MONRO|nr:sc15 protein [Moniliophthora roreri MCA 2997]KAI3616473.1 sc15 protein [Moniliophthora roreri]